MSKCPDCHNEKKPESMRCVTCSFKYTKEKTRLQRQQKEKKRIVYTLKCEECNFDFNTYELKDKYCSDRCKKIVRNREVNENWINRDHDFRNKQDGNKLDYDRVRKKNTGWLKKFNSVRG